MTDGVILVLRVALSLGVVLVLLWFLARQIGKTRSSQPGATISVTARQSLSRHASVAVVEVDRRRLLLGIADTGITLVAELEEAPLPDPVAEDTEAPQRQWERALSAATKNTPSGSILDPTTWRRAWLAVRGQR